MREDRIFPTGGFVPKEVYIMKTNIRRRIKLLLLALSITVMGIGASLEVHAAAVKPAPPTITSIKNADFTSVKITWKKVKNAKKYEVYRSKDGKTFKFVERITTASYIDEDLVPGKTYWYKLKAVNGSQKSAFSKAKKYKLPDWITNFKDMAYEISETYYAAEDEEAFTYTFKKFGGEQYSYITYIESLKELRFGIEGTANGTPYTLVMYINAKDYAAKKARVVYTRKGTEKAELTAKVNIVKHNGKKAIAFTVAKNETKGISASALKKEANQMLKTGFYAWGKIIKKEMKLTMKKVGFRKMLY